MNIRAFHAVYRIVPKQLRRSVWRTYGRLSALLARPFQTRRQRDIVRRIRKGQAPVRAVFLMLTPSVWKYDELYRLMADDPRFDTQVFVCPWVVANGGHPVGDGAPGEGVSAMMDTCMDFCRKQGYFAVKAWNGRWLDLDGELRPDLVFFSYAYNMTRTDYLQQGVQRALSCYVTYGFNTDGQEQRQFNLPFFNRMWLGFYETPMHVAMARKFADNGGVNVRLGGPLIFDEMRRRLREGPHSPWKTQGKKRIIWAPHHTVDDLPNESHLCCFLQMADPMLELARKLEDGVEFAFKPHPKLFPKLCMLPSWGERRAREYYAAWDALPNGQLQQGEYIDLFLTSDAMILDCLSFMCEYMFTGNPQLFTLREAGARPRFNEFGEAVFGQLYRGIGMEAVERFIDEIVVSGNDRMKARRMEFFRQTVDAVPAGASRNVFRLVSRELGLPPLPGEDVYESMEGGNPEGVSPGKPMETRNGQKRLTT